MGGAEAPYSTHLAITKVVELKIHSSARLQALPLRRCSVEPKSN
jgi:hypothetical protein